MFYLLGIVNECFLIFFWDNLSRFLFPTLLNENILSKSIGFVHTSVWIISWVFFQCVPIRRQPKETALLILHFTIFGGSKVKRFRLLFHKTKKTHLPSQHPIIYRWERIKPLDKERCSEVGHEEGNKTKNPFLLMLNMLKTSSKMVKRFQGIHSWVSSQKATLGSLSQKRNTAAC